MTEYIEKATLLNRVIIPSICSCVQGPTAERLKKFCIDTVNNVSAADVAPVVHGRWVYHNFDTICSECRKSAIFDEWEQQAETEFCPHCGAKMYEEEHNNV